jgi:hypothetical protein
MSQAHLSLSCAAAARLTRLLTDLVATPGIGPDHRYELAYCREQVREHLPVIEGLVIAGLLLEAPDRLALDRPTRTACQQWAHELIAALSCPLPTTEPRYRRWCGRR